MSTPEKTASQEHYLSSRDREKNLLSEMIEAMDDIAKHQDKQAFIKLFSYYAPRLKSFLMRGGFPEQKAEELAQETLLVVWKRAKSFNPKKASPSTWIYTIARNKKIDYLRKHLRPEPNPEDLKHDDQTHPIDALQRKQESEEITKLMKDLPKEQAKLIKKAFYEDKSHQEIADETSIPLGTVKSRIRLALKKLKTNLNEEMMSLS